MATPTVPASQSAAVKAAQIRAGSSLYETNLETLAKIILSRREGYKDELLQLYKSVTTTRTELGKLGQDTFIELADLSKDYYKIASAGNVNPKDALDAYIKILGLEAKINKDMGTSDKQLIQNLTTRADAMHTRGSPEWNKAVGDMYLDIEANTAVSPYRVATYDKISELIGGDLATVSTDPRAAKLAADVQDRKESASRLSSTAAVIRRDIGDLAKLSQIANSGNGDLIKQTAAAIAPTLDQAMSYASKFPGKSDLAARLKEDEARITALKNRLDEDPMAAIQSFVRSTTAEEKRDVDFYKTIGSPKFQRWAASNNLMVGKMRPATTEADKSRVGYIPELDAVYEAGPDDQRAMVVAYNQSQMRPGAQLFTRRGLESRRNVEVKLGTKGTEREVMVDRSGNEVTPEQVAAQTTFTRMGVIDGDTVYIRPDGSGRSKTKEYTQDDLAYVSEKPLTDDQAKQVSEAVRKASFTTTKVMGEPTGVQTLRGRETAMLPSDPPDTLYVIETTDGRRVPIRESQILGETVIDKGEAAPAGGPMKVVEEPRMALRKPLAMLRARGARLKEEKGVEEPSTPEETPAKVIELPARTGVSAGSSPVPAGMETPASLKRKEATVALREPLLRMNLAEAKRDAAIAGLQEQALKEGGITSAPTAEVGRDIRKATGAEQTGKAAETVAASIPPIAIGTLKNAPAMPGRAQYERGTQQVEENYEGLGKLQFTPAELAEMNKPETDAQRKARVMREMRSKLGETPATAPMP